LNYSANIQKQTNTDQDIANRQPVADVINLRINVNT